MNEKLMQKSTNSINRGMKWLLENHEEILRYEDINAHYKACYLYAVTGKPGRARKYADLFREKYLRSDGDFRTAEDSKGFYNLPCSPANRYVYSNGWIVTGLQKMGEYQSARRGIEFLEKMQSDELGGFYSSYDIKNAKPDTKYVDTSSSSSAGLAMLSVGKYDRAVATGEFILKLLEAQPDTNRYYFSSWEVGKGLRTDVFGDENQNSLYGRKQTCLDAKADPTGELIWLLGKPMKFLSKLYGLTRDKRYIEGAQKLFDIFERMDDTKYDQLAACKIMWGGAELYRYTGNERVRDAVVRILEAICDNQDECGLWLHRLWYKSLEEQSFSMSLDCVQEMCLEITDVIFDLGM